MISCALVGAPRPVVISSCQQTETHPPRAIDPPINVRVRTFNFQASKMQVHPGARRIRVPQICHYVRPCNTTLSWSVVHLCEPCCALSSITAAIDSKEKRWADRSQVKIMKPELFWCLTCSHQPTSLLNAAEPITFVQLSYRVRGRNRLLACNGIEIFSY